MPKIEVTGDPPVGPLQRGLPSAVSTLLSPPQSTRPGPLKVPRPTGQSLPGHWVGPDHEASARRTKIGVAYHPKIHAPSAEDNEDHDGQVDCAGERSRTRTLVGSPRRRGLPAGKCCDGRARIAARHDAPPAAANAPMYRAARAHTAAESSVPAVSWWIMPGQDDALRRRRPWAG